MGLAKTFHVCFRIGNLFPGYTVVVEHLQGRGIIFYEHRVGSLQFHGCLVLTDNHTNSIGCSSGQRNEKVHFLIGSEHEGNGASFAMSDDTHFSEDIELAEEINAGFGIGQVIQGSGVFSRTSRLGYTTIVISQRSDSLLGQIVGNHQERLVLEDFFVPVLASTTCYEQHHRDGTFGHELVIDRICQCTR